MMSHDDSSCIRMADVYLCTFQDHGLYSIMLQSYSGSRPAPNDRTRSTSYLRLAPS